MKSILIVRSIRYAVWIVVLALAVSSCKSGKKAATVTTTDTEQRPEEVVERMIDTSEADEELMNQSRKPELPKSTTESLSGYFDAIANASSTASANSSIQEALTMFASPVVPVLIAIYYGPDDVDYDEPTTIDKYLNYIKDQRKNANKINDIRTNDAGKITELELIKK
ncbi:MAG: nucleoid-structuring protein H-NS [Bacteroidota bacterium]